MFALEHSRPVYWADFGFYAVLIGTAAIGLPTLAPRDQWAAMAALAATGLATWSLVEYLMHRFVLHGLQPFKSWHLRHHERPTALISSPTVLTATLMVVLVFAPAALMSTRWMAAALTVGIVIGYLTYALCHHGTHHWRSRTRWLMERKLWHAIHHKHQGGQCYGVTTTLWDRVFGTTPVR